MSGTEEFWDAIDGLRERSPGYAREAYGFVMHALGETVRGLPQARRDHPTDRHLSGRELLGGTALLARSEFGDLAAMVFREWGVCASEDVGRIVFQLVEDGQLSARPEDTIDDFRSGFDLMAALGAPDSTPRGAEASGPGSAA